MPRETNVIITHLLLLVVLFLVGEYVVAMGEVEVGSAVVVEVEGSVEVRMSVSGGEFEWAYSVDAVLR